LPKAKLFNKVNNMENKEKLKKIILDSSILEEEKDLWYQFLEKETEEEINSMLEFLEDNPKMLDSLTENLKTKSEP